MISTSGILVVAMFKDLFRHSFIYGIASILQNAAGFFLLPLYTAYLTVSDYGILEAIIVSVTILISILQLGLGSALFKYYAYDETDNPEQSANRLIISSTFFFLLIFVGCIIAAALFFVEDLSVLLFDTAQYRQLMTLLLVIVLLESMYVVPIAYLRIQNRSVVISLLRGGSFLSQVSLTIFFIVGLNQKIDGVLYARVLTGSVFAFLFVWFIRNEFVRRFSIRVIRELLSYSVFLIPVSICNLILMMSNRYFILLFYDSEALGLFSVPNKIASLLLLAVSAFQMAWPSIMFRIKDREDARAVYSRVLSYYIFLFLFFLLILSSFSGELILLLSNSKYFAGRSYIVVLCLSYFFYGFFYVGTVGINIFKKTYYQTIATVTGAVVNLALNYWLTPIYGIMGTCIVLCVSYALVGVLAMLFSQRIYRVPIEWERILKYLLSFAAIAFVCALGQAEISLTYFLLKFVVIFLLFPLVLIVTRIVTPAERRAALSSVHNLWLHVKWYHPK